jgi:hypothetical protein
VANRAGSLNGPERLVLLRLAPAETYRKLAAQLRETARAKSDRYARSVLCKTADDYDAFADHVEGMRAVYHPAAAEQPQAASAAD